jgi:hypothetical protein
MAAKPKKSNSVTPEQASKALAKARAEQKMADQMRQGIKAQQQRNKADVSRKQGDILRETKRQQKVKDNKAASAKRAEAAKVDKAAGDFIKKEKAKQAASKQAAAKQTGVKGKLKAQGSKIMSSATSGYGRKGKK